METRKGGFSTKQKISSTITGSNKESPQEDSKKTRPNNTPTTPTLTIDAATLTPRDSQSRSIQQVVSTSQQLKKPHPNEVIVNAVVGTTAFQNIKNLHKKFSIVQKVLTSGTITRSTVEAIDDLTKGKNKGENSVGGSEEFWQILKENKVLLNKITTRHSDAYISPLTESEVIASLDQEFAALGKVYLENNKFYFYESPECKNAAQGFLHSLYTDSNINAQLNDAAEAKKKQKYSSSLAAPVISFVLAQDNNQLVCYIAVSSASKQPKTMEEIVKTAQKKNTDGNVRYEVLQERNPIYDYALQRINTKLYKNHELIDCAEYYYAGKLMEKYNADPGFKVLGISTYDFQPVDTKKLSKNADVLTTKPCCPVCQKNKLGFLLTCNAAKRRAFQLARSVTSQTEVKPQTPAKTSINNDSPSTTKKLPPRQPQLRGWKVKSTVSMPQIAQQQTLVDSKTSHLSCDNSITQTTETQLTETSDELSTSLMSKLTLDDKTSEPPVTGNYFKGTTEYVKFGDFPEEELFIEETSQENSENYFGLSQPTQQQIAFTRVTLPQTTNIETNELPALETVNHPPQNYLQNGYPRINHPVPMQNAYYQPQMTANYSSVNEFQPVSQTPYFQPPNYRVPVYPVPVQQPPYPQSHYAVPSHQVYPQPQPHFQAPEENYMHPYFDPRQHCYPVVPQHGSYPVPQSHMQPHHAQAHPYYPTQPQYTHVQPYPTQPQYTHVHPYPTQPQHPSQNPYVQPAFIPQQYLQQCYQNNIQTSNVQSPQLNTPSVYPFSHQQQPFGGNNRFFTPAPLVPVNNLVPGDNRKELIVNEEDSNKSSLRSSQ